VVALPSGMGRGGVSSKQDWAFLIFSLFLAF
jgi:hypothetical protein